MTVHRLFHAPLKVVRLIRAYLSGWTWSIRLAACAREREQYAPDEIARRHAARLQDGNLSRRATFWSNFSIGRAWYAAGEFTQAEPALRAAAALAESPLEHCCVQGILGMTLQRIGHLDEAEIAYRAELAAACDAGHGGAQATAFSNLGGILHAHKNYEQALAFYTQSLSLPLAENDKATVLNNMAVVHSAQGDHARAAELRRQAIAIARRTGDSHGLAVYLLNLGNACRELQQWQDCSAALSEGLALARANGDRFQEAVGLEYWGRTFWDNGQTAQAREQFEAALAIFRDIGATGKAARVEASLLEFVV